jgi:hypothetical protein
MLADGKLRIGRKDDHRLAILPVLTGRIAVVTTSEICPASTSRLDRAYVGARYSPAYEITNEELAWLTERVAHLQGLVERICLARLEGTIA